MNSHLTSQRHAPPCDLQVDELFALLETGAAGLSSIEAAIRLQRFGPNIIVAARHTSLLLKFLLNFTHLMALLLWTGGTLAFVGGLPQMGWAIWAVILINAVFSFWQEYRAEKAVEALRRLLPLQARVLRDGQEQTIAAEELVPGDLILIREGDRISADGRLVAETELRVDQSAISGESHPVRKTADPVRQTGLSSTEMPNLVFGGTSAVAGAGRAVVYATGASTEFGRIAQLTSGMEEQPSPLQIEINRMTRVVTLLAVGIGMVFFVLSVTIVHQPLQAGFIFAVGMVVAFVPEGLLPTVTLALAMGVQRMARRNALVKKLSSVETLGCCTVICTDKTGTLTQNEMTVREIWTASTHYSVTGAGYAPAGEIIRDGAAVHLSATGDLHSLLLAAGLCNDARLLHTEPADGTWRVIGDPTEAALKVVAQKGGLDLAAEAERLPRLRELPFDSGRKRMSTIHQVAGGALVFVKGAPREVIGLCSTVLADGEVIALQPDLREQALAANDTYARQGLRILAVAQRRLPAAISDFSAAAIEKDLVLLGLVAMLDPPRPEVSEAVAKCHKAGIRIIMITGDYGLTAESIAHRIGILREASPRLISGADVERLDERELRDQLQHEVIFARVAPEHKLRVVQALQQNGQIVAVTGDGVNDAPALKRADIGIAMGMSGTDVAKEAADMILLDDNFASVVNAVEEGRGVYANIRKFATYIFTSNVPEAWPFILQIMLNIPLALTVMQVLAIDLGTDMLPALALGTEAPEPGVMERPPRPRKERLINKDLLLRALVWLGSLQALLCFLGYFLFYMDQGYYDLLHLPRFDLLPDRERLTTPQGEVYVLATSVFLAGVVATQVGNACACRTERLSVFTVGLFSNRFLLLGFVFELAILVLLIYLPLLQSIFHTGPLPLKYWAVLLFFPPAIFLAEEGRKAVVRRRGKAGPANRGGTS